MAIRTPEAMLLTGAGFTHNFGGYLANDMWAEIFNHKAVQRHRCLREEMYSPVDLFDFEDVYDRVLHGTFSNEEKDSMVEAVVSVYGDLDKIIREFWQTSYSISLLKVPCRLQPVTSRERICSCNPYCDDVPLTACIFGPGGNS